MARLCTTSNSTIQYGAAPVSRDWRSEGVVTRVKSQGVCGSCWAFSATGCVESHHAIKHGTQVLLSEQNLVDCAHAFNNHGCFGGLPSQAFEYIHYNGGIDTEASYRYKAWGGKCQFDQRHVGARVDAVVNITSRNEDELKAAVGAVGPVSIAFQSRLDMMFYKSGVYASTKCHDEETYVNHAVLAVGFGTTAGNGDSTPFWIVKNSWSDKWGMDGYFLIKRGVNMCGLADCASYVVVV
jgi:cathepsin H